MFWVSVFLRFWVWVYFLVVFFVFCLVCCCFFACLLAFKRTSVIAPIYNSYDRKFSKAAKGQMQRNCGHDAAEGSRSSMAISSSLLRCAILRKREWVALSMN